MKTRTQILCVLAMFSLFAGCLANSSQLHIAESVKNPSVHIMVNKAVSIPKTAKYSWGPNYFKVKDHQSIDLDAAVSRIRNAVREEMEKKQYVFVESADEADVLIGFALALDASIDETDLNKAYGKEFEFSFPVTEGGQTLSYHHGALLIDFVDTHAKKLLWRGALVAEVDMDVSEKAKDERAGPIVRALLDCFPKPKTH